MWCDIKYGMMNMKHDHAELVAYYTSQQDFGPRKVYCVPNVTFHAESKYAIKIFPSPTVFAPGPFNY
jgi:hypothetical protein